MFAGLRRAVSDVMRTRCLVMLANWLGSDSLIFDPGMPVRATNIYTLPAHIFLVNMRNGVNKSRGQFVCEAADSEKVRRRLHLPHGKRSDLRGDHLRVPGGCHDLGVLPPAETGKPGRLRSAERRSRHVRFGLVGAGLATRTDMRAAERGFGRLGRMPPARTPPGRCISHSNRRLTGLK